jgi:nitrous oxide reductase
MSAYPITFKVKQHDEVDLTVINMHEIMMVARTFLHPPGASNLAWSSQTARLENMITIMRKSTIVAS